MTAKQRKIIEEAIITYGVKCYRLGVRAGSSGEVVVRPPTSQLEREANASRDLISVLLGEATVAALEAV